LNLREETVFLVDDGPGEERKPKQKQQDNAGHPSGLLEKTPELAREKNECDIRNR
jgi:hypothetical protein